jgi:hypothetical protein
MTVRPTLASGSESKDRWTPTRTIQALAVLCVLLAMMCLGLAVLWQRQHEAAECWRAAAQYHLAPESCGLEPESLT